MTDVIITIGPASWTPEVLTRLAHAGVTAIRFPFAKEDPAVHVRNLTSARKAFRAARQPLLAIADLPGGQPRLSNAEPLEVVEGRRMQIALRRSDAAVQANDLYVDPPIDAACIESGAGVVIGDGECTFIVEEVSDDVCVGAFARSMTLQQRRAFTPTSELLMIDAFTEADQAFALAARESRFDAIALSFVDSRGTVDHARAWLRDRDWKPQLIAKIETSRGVANAADIAKSADAVMVARGDLVLQIGFAALWSAQKTIIDAAARQSTYSIVATGLLESLVDGEGPTRSESIDVAAAVAMGADALMLSAETTIGHDPVRAVEVLQRLASSGGRT